MVRRLCATFAACFGECPDPTAVWIPLFSGAGDLVAVFVHAPALAGAAVALGRLEVAFVGTPRDVRA